MSLLQNGIHTTPKTRAIADRADAAVEFDPVHQCHGCVVKRRIHQIGAARRKALTIDTDQYPVTKQAAILDLAGKAAIVDQCGTGHPRDQRCCVRGGNNFLVTFDLVGGHHVALTGDDDIGERVGFGKSRGGKGNVCRKDGQYFSVHDKSQAAISRCTGGRKKCNWRDRSPSR